MRSIGKTVIIIIAFILYYIASRYFKVTMEYVDKAVHYRLASYIITYILNGVPLFIGTIIVTHHANIFKSWGLTSNILKGILLGVVFTLPMFIGGLLSYDINSDISIPNLMAGTILAGFFEEAYFRGFLFGMLFRYTRMGFIPAVVVGAVIFATGHLYQSTVFTEQAGIFLVTFLGSGFFAWLYVEWKYNLWVAVFAHTFMNLSWMAFSLSDNAMGSMYANIFRALTIAIAITTTVIYKIRTKKRFEVNKETLWLRRDDGVNVRA